MVRLSKGFEVGLTWIDLSNQQFLGDDCSTSPMSPGNPGAPVNLEYKNNQLGLVSHEPLPKSDTRLFVEFF